MKTILLPLSDLYEKKITSSVETAIQSKEDFSKISSQYCRKVCKLNCKAYENVVLARREVDILIIQDHIALPGMYDRKEGQQEEVMQGIIHHIAMKAGFAGLSYGIVNLLKCPLSEADLVKGKAPTATKLLKCKPYLLAEIDRCKPKVIISLTTAVTKALGYKKHSNTGNRGEIVDNRVVITLHPKVLTMIRQNSSGQLWGQELHNVIVRDFAKAARIARGQLVVPDQTQAIAELVEKRMIFATSIEDVKTIIERINALSERAVVSWDTETTSLDPHIPSAKLILIQFGWRDPATGVIIAGVIPLWHRQNTFYDADEAWELIHPLLTGPRVKASHNGKFDILYTWFTTGIRVRNNVFDTMLMLHSLDSGGQGTFSLKTAVWDWIPEMGFGGYEDLLPKLTKGAGIEEQSEEEVESE